MTVYHPIRKFSFRPDNVRLVPDHPLSDGLLLAGLGTLSGSDRYHDSSLQHNDGVKIGHSDIQIFGRHGLHYLDVAGRVTTQVPLNSATFSMSGWANVESSAKGEILGDERLSYNYVSFVPLRSIGYTYCYLGNGSTFGSHNWQHGYPLNEWHHHVVTRASGQNIRGYTDAQEYSVTSGTNYTTNCVVNVRDDNTPYELVGSLLDPMIWNRVLEDFEIEILSQIYDPMYDGWLEAVPSETYFLPLGEAPQPTELVTSIFESAIFD